MPFIKRASFALLFLLINGLYSREILLSVSGKVYGPGEPVWVSIAVLDSTTAPGAYDIRIKYDPAFLSAGAALAPENSSFRFSPAVHNSEDGLRLAGFQGVSETFKAPYTVLCLLSFKSLNKDKLIDKSLFQWVSQEVYSVEGKSMNLTPLLKTSPVMQPPVLEGTAFMPFFQLTGPYLRFNMPVKDRVTLTLYNTSGRARLVQFRNMFLLPGTHAFPVGGGLPPGAYIAVLKGAKTNLSGKLGVVK
jgi:hypothetical protein